MPYQCYKPKTAVAKNVVLDLTIDSFQRIAVFVCSFTSFLRLYFGACDKLIQHENHRTTSRIYLRFKSTCLSSPVKQKIVHRLYVFC